MYVLHQSPQKEKQVHTVSPVRYQGIKDKVRRSQAGGSLVPRRPAMMLVRVIPVSHHQNQRAKVVFTCWPMKQKLDPC
eukprot:bmy_19418T0